MIIPTTSEKSMQRVLMIGVGDGSLQQGTDSYLFEPFQNLGYDLDILPIPGNKKATILMHMMCAKINWSDYDAAIATEYTRAAALAIRARGRELTTGVIGLNQSGSLLKSKFKPVNQYIDHLFQSLNVSVVHSQLEQQMWHQIHGIDMDKLPFAHWGYDLPKIDSTRFSTKTEPYFCMIGRNNRDMSTFSAAIAKADTRGVIIATGVQTCAPIAKADTRGVIIASQYNTIDFEVPDCVDIEFDLSLDECLDCLRGAIANVILVQDGSRGAGHITAVSGMHLAKPAVFTDTDTIKDYLIDGMNGIAVPMHDVGATAAAFTQLASCSDLCRRLGEQGHNYAEKWLTTIAAGTTHVDLIDRAIQRKPLPPIPNGWTGTHGLSRPFGSADQERSSP